MNLLKETLDDLARAGKSPSDVRWVGGYSGFCTETAFSGSWDDFSAMADFDYSNSYGGAEVNRALKIVGDDWWLERGEYDGSEWWEFKTMPVRPDASHPIRAADLRER